MHPDPDTPNSNPPRLRRSCNSVPESPLCVRGSRHTVARYRRPIDLLARGMFAMQNAYSRIMRQKLEMTEDSNRFELGVDMIRLPQ